MVNIYVSVASYRDPFLQSTIDHAYATAKYPENVNFGCFIQVMDTDSTFPSQLVTNTYSEKVKYKVLPAGKIFSVTECRNRANRWLSEKHKYVLQIDSHTRFEPNWDERLVAYHKELDNPKSLFSSYLTGWKPDETRNDILDPCSTEYFSFASYTSHPVIKESFLRSYELVPKLERYPRNPGTFETSWYLCGHFIFGPATYFKEVKQPDWILFWGEEVYNSLIAFTNGWDVFIPPTLPLRHLFPQDVPLLPLNKIWQDFPELWGSLRQSSTDMVIDSILERTTGEGYLGKKRPLDELYDYLGYDLGNLFKDWRDEYKALR